MIEQDACHAPHTASRSSLPPFARGGRGGRLTSRSRQQVGRAAYRLHANTTQKRHSSEYRPPRRRLSQNHNRQPRPPMPRTSHRQVFHQTPLRQRLIPWLEKQRNRLANVPPRLVERIPLGDTTRQRRNIDRIAPLIGRLEH